MSHGGMGGGGGHGGHGGHGGSYGGHGHHGHHGGHGAFGMHADQSPSWNMAMQAERCEKELGRKLTIADPRVVVGVALFVFVTLITLPYTLDYLQSQGLEGPSAGEPPEADSSGPSAAALSMVGTTLMGGHVELPEKEIERVVGREPCAGNLRENNDSNTRAMKQRSGSEASLPGLAEQQAAAMDAAKQTAYGSTAIAEKSASDTVESMLEASGMRNAVGSSAAVVSPAVANASLLSGDPVFAGGAQRIANAPSTAAMSAVPSSFGSPISASGGGQEGGARATIIPQGAGLTMTEYGGAVRGPNQQYYVYIPGQQINTGLPAASIPAANSAAPTTQDRIVQAGRQLAMAPPAAAPPQYDTRSPFNPQTSATVSLQGHRRHGAAGPMMPLLPSNPGQDGNQRFRVWASR